MPEFNDDNAVYTADPAQLSATPNANPFPAGAGGDVYVADPSQLSATPNANPFPANGEQIYVADPSQLSAMPGEARMRNVALGSAFEQMMNQPIPLPYADPTGSGDQGSYTPRTMGDQIAAMPLSGMGQQARGVQQIANSANSGRDAARGAGNVGLGTLQAVSPLTLPFAAAAPVEALLLGTVSQGAEAGAKWGAQKLGANEEDASEIGGVAGAVPLIIGGLKLGKDFISSERTAMKGEVAEHWENEAQARPGAQTVEVPVLVKKGSPVEQTPVTMGGETRIPIKISRVSPLNSAIQGEESKGPIDAYIEYADTSTKDGAAVYRVVGPDGKIHYGGTAKMVAEWLRTNAAEPNWLQRLQQFTREPDLTGEAAIPEDTTAKSDLVKTEQILNEHGNPQGGAVEVGDPSELSATPRPEEGAGAGNGSGEYVVDPNGKVRFEQGQAAPEPEPELTADERGDGEEHLHALEGESEPEPEPEAEATREPWQMTSDEYLASKGIIAGHREIALGHKEHSLAVYEAVRQGKPVPENVLAEYPNARATAGGASEEQPEPEPTEETHPPEDQENGGFDEEQPDALPSQDIVSLLVSKIHADPVRFQFKRDTGGAAGTGEELKNVQTFNRAMFGAIGVWHDPADGKTYVVNGHHRLELAKRLGIERVDARYLDAANAGEARQIGALINIGEKNGTPVDAAKIFRESGLTQAQIESTYGVSMKGPIARQGMALAKLAPSIFDRVVQGDLPVERATIIGESLPDHDEQQAVLALLDKAEARGKRPTNGEVKELIDFVKNGPKETVEETQTSLFGETEIRKNAAWEKAEISDYIRKRLGAEKRLFQTAGSARSAEQLSAAGNVINAEGNARIAEQAGMGLALYDKLKSSAGEINNALDEAARELVHGRSNAQDVKAQAYERIREILGRELERFKGTNHEGSLEASQSGSAAQGEAKEDDGEVNPLFSASRRDANFDLDSHLLTSLRELRESGFYSQLERVIESSKMPAKVSPAQALAILTNPQHGVKADELKWTGLDDFLKNYKGATLTKKELLSEARLSRIHVHERWYDSPHARYESWVLGGHRRNYQELVFTYTPPSRPAFRAWKKLHDQLAHQYGPDFESRRYDDDPLTPQERAHYEAAQTFLANEQDNNRAEIYHSPHWDNSNVIAHTRFDSRFDSDKRRVLFIEEIQSDWHQQGRDKGYKKNLPAPPNYATFAREQFGMTDAEVNKTWQTTDEHFRAWQAVTEEWEKDLDRIAPAPFSKTWHELVFRRLVRYAVEQGYDAIAWTTGAQQAQRYDLAKRVSAVAFRPLPSGFTPRTGGPPTTEGMADPYGILYYRAKPKGDEDPDLLPWHEVQAQDSGIMRASQLPDYLGKEIAQKLIAQPLERSGEYTAPQHVLAGDDLQVGGHGMNGFYDVVLPLFAGKFGKKFGAKVDTAQVDIRNHDHSKLVYTGPEYSLEQVSAAHKAATRAYQIGGPLTQSPFTGRPFTFENSHRFLSRALGELLEHLTDARNLNQLTPATFAQSVERVVNVAEVDISSRARELRREHLGEVLGGKLSLRSAKPKYQTVHSLPITDAMRKSVMEGQPLFNVRNAPRLSSGRDDQYKEKASTLYHARQMRFEHIPLTGEEAKHALAFVTNLSGIEYVGRSSAGYAVDEAAGKVGGLALVPTPETLGIALTKARFEQDRIFGKGTPPALRELVRMMEQAFASNKTLVLVADDERHPATAAVLEEELNHALQFAETGNVLEHLKDSARDFAGFGTPARDYLEIRNGYRFVSEGQAALEIGARLMSGEYARLGLDQRQGIALSERYVQLLKKEYGDHAAKGIIQKVEDARRSVLGRSAPARGGDQPRRTGEPPTEGSGTPTSLRERGLFDAADDDDTDAKRQNPLFDASENQEVAESAARDRDQLEGDRLSAQLNAPLTREEQLKKLKRSKDNPQSSFFEERKEDSPQGSLFGDESGSIHVDLATLGLTQFVKRDVLPHLKLVAPAWNAALDDFLKLTSPASREGAAPAGLSVRHRAAQLQRATDRALAALRIAAKYFDTQTQAFKYEFIARMEDGQAQATPELDKFAAIIREILDKRREAIRALGKGKLEHFILDYFPHIWKKPGAAADFYANVGKRPLEGSKAFLKKRSIDSFADGIAAGLEPISDNPVELVLLKAREMDKYIAGQQILADLKEKGVTRYVDARDTKLQTGLRNAGYIPINDPSATVYGPSVQNISEYPNEGIWSGLEKVAAALGVKHERGFLNLHGAVGRASRNSEIRTLHGTAEDVVAHEIGHQIDFLAGSGKRFIEEYPDPQTVARLKRARKALKNTKVSTPAERTFARKELKDLAPAIQQRKAFAKELRDLADLRNARPEYTHKREEKMAQLAEMWVGAREQFERTAPTVFKEWKAFLNANPKLHALRDIEGNTELLALSQPYDVGGLVIKGYMWAPEPAASIVNNYLSAGLRDKSALFRGFLSLGNIINQAQLGFSAFHLGFTTLDVAISKLALGIYQIAHGDVVEGLKSAAFTPLAPFSNIMRGDKLLREWYDQGNAISPMLDALMQAGGRAHMDSFYQTKVTQNMMAALRAFNLPGALVRLPFAAMEQAARPIMEYVVPRQKLGVFADLAAYELKRLGPNADPEHVQAALARAWDSVDNRLGQMTYDNLFWHKVIKDLAMVSVRSVGWNVGTIRELAGAGVDTMKLLSGGGNGVPKLRQNKNGSYGPGVERERELTLRMSYAIALPLLLGLIGAVYYYLRHGRAPKELRDYFVLDGYLPPSYMKDVFAWIHDPVGTARGKIYPLVDAILQMLGNKDFHHHKIRNPHHSLVKQAEEMAVWALKVFKPIAYDDDRKGHHPTAKERALGFFGVKRAPKYLTK
jgi:hypothetical protein